MERGKGEDCIRSATGIPVTAFWSGYALLTNVDIDLATGQAMRENAA